MSVTFWIMQTLIGAVLFSILIGVATAVALYAREKRRPLPAEPPREREPFFYRYELPE